MEKEMTMPRLGESVTEGTIVDWLVKPGDHVAKYDPICEVQTVKVIAEVPATFDGELVAILAESGTTVAVGAGIATIETTAIEADEVAASEPASTSAVATAAPTTVTTAPAAPAAVVPATKSTTTPRFSPAVATLLAEHNLQAAEIPATGHQGRLTRKDVLAFLARPKAPAAPTPTPAPVPQHVVESSSVAGQDTLVQASSIRRVIAQKMSLSKAEIPHGWMMVEHDVSKLVRLRQAKKAAFQQQEGFKLTYFPFFVKAVAQALVKHPRLNSSWQEGQIVVHHDINISIAVAKDDELYVPVIQHADRLSLKGIAAEIDRLALAVRQGTITPDEMQGGTFTVNNTGSFGSVASMGIINYPQAAILQVESIRKQLIPTPDGLGFKTADMVNLSLSVDHRLLDGVAAGGFLTDVKHNLDSFQPEMNLD